MSISRIAPFAIIGAGLLAAGGVWLGLRTDHRQSFGTGGPRFSADWSASDSDAPPPTYTGPPAWGPYARAAALRAGVPRLADTVVADDGAVYVASDGTLRAFEAKTLKPLGQATYRERSERLPDTEAQ